MATQEKTKTSKPEKKSDPVIDSLIEYFEQMATASDYKPGSKAYRDAEISYFMGAGKALELMGKTIPPIWHICLMCGRSIIAESKRS